MIKKLNAYAPLLLVLTVFIALTGKTLFSEGMFMDGMIYAAVSKNMASGLGTFWQPHLSETLYPAFYQHPPLALGLEALAFKIFGNSLLVERFYSLFSYFFVVFFLVKIWTALGKNAKSAWIPVAFWLANPLVIWAVSNNMLENTMQIFILAALCLLLLNLKNGKKYLIALAGILLFFAFFTKGPVGLFLWSFYFWVWLFSKQIGFNQMVLNSLLLIGFTVLPLALLYFTIPQAAHSFTEYFHNQLEMSFQDVSQTVDSRWFIVQRFFNEILLNLALLFIVFVLSKKNTLLLKETWKQNKKMVLIIGGIGFSGILPIMVSMKQSGFYMLPALPFFALVFGLLSAPLIGQMTEHWKKQNFITKHAGILSLMAFVVVFGIGLSFRNTVGRDKELIHDTHAILSQISSNEVVQIPKSLAQDWPLHASFARYANVSLNDISKKPLLFYLTQKGQKPTIQAPYEKVNIKLEHYTLYKLK